VRGTVKYFISTHFYVNKYEYRDEWVAFSSLLQGTLTEREVVDALHRILNESLFTHQVMIWLGDVQEGFRLIDGDKDHDRSADAVIASDDPLVLYLKNEQYFYLEMRENTQARQLIISEKRDFFHRSELVLMVPLTIGGQCVGLIGLGPEYTGGRYGRDDFDLLTALGSQAASAILAARTAEKLAQARETSAWDTLSAFVLHDLKNAATMLSLVKENAPAHIHKPEFQQDLLGSVDDALKRMHKVQERLYTLKGEKTPVIKEVEIGRFVRDCCKKLARKLPNLTIDVQCRQNLTVHTDPEIITQILENLMLNALEAGDPGILAHVNVSNADHKTFQFEFTDSGPGIAEELLPDRLFVPFKTTKPNGIGIGLWQAKRLVEGLGGTIEAKNVDGGGAKFVVRLPLNRFPSD
jgi:putative PEP-CTERM system histidine kinase